MAKTLPSASRSNPLPIYAAIMLGAFVIALDFASVDLALPALERQFGLDLDSVQWVINGYVLAFSVLMVAGGRCADAYGRRRVFLLGIGIFTLASLLGGAGWNGAAVIAFRVLQGIGAALLWPAMIGMACEAVGDARRGFALGLIFGTCSVGNAAGPIVGGALTEWFSWRWVLWINVPLALVAIALTVLHVPRDKPVGGTTKNDFPGMVALTGGLVALMLVVYQVQSWGWADPRLLGLAVLAVGLLGAFPFIERRSSDPLIPLDLFRNREIATLCFCVIAICQIFFVVLLYFTQYALKFLGDDPVAAGARVVQFMLLYGLVSYFGGPLLKIFGARRLLVIGLLSTVAASVLLAFYGPGSAPVPFNLSLCLLGIGVGAVIPTVSSRAIETVGAARASLVSGLTFMCQLSGAALMLAINTAVFTWVGLRALVRGGEQQGMSFTADQLTIAREVLTGARSVHAVPVHTASALDGWAALVAQAYQDGLQVVMLAGAGMALVALVLVLRYVPRKTA